MATKPTLRTAVPKTKIKASDWNWNFDKLNDYIENSVADNAIKNYEASYTYAKGDWAKATVDDEISIYESQVDGNKGQSLLDNTYWEKVSMGGTGLEICDIGMSLYVDESKGLRRYLNGSIVTINKNTQNFLNKLLVIKAQSPSLFDTEANWQAIKEASSFDQVGKFVLNYADDEETVVSVRLPRVVNVHGLFDLQNLGMTVSAGASNIGGEAIQYPYFIQIATGVDEEVDITNEIELNNPFSFGDFKHSPYALNNISWLKSSGQWNAKSTYTDFYTWLLTERNNGVKQVYGWSTADDVNYFTLSATPSVGDIVYGGTPLATVGAVTEVSTTTTTITVGEVTATANEDLNGFQYISEFSQMPVRTVDEDYTDYDFLIKTSDETFRLPLKSGSEEVIDNSNITTICSSVTTYTYTVPCNGVIRHHQYWEKTGDGSEQCDITINGKAYEIISNEREGTFYNIQVKRGDIISFQTTANLLTVTQYFVPYKGNGSLYYYVGETVQNANLIDAGRIEEQIVNMEALPHIVETYVNGTSWYRVYSDGWCEQGGITGTIAGNTKGYKVNLLKIYINQQYVIYTTPYTIKGASWLPAKNQASLVHDLQLNSFRINQYYSESYIKVFWMTMGYIR